MVLLRLYNRHVRGSMIAFISCTSLDDFNDTMDIDLGQKQNNHDKKLSNPDRALKVQKNIPASQEYEIQHFSVHVVCR